MNTPLIKLKDLAKKYRQNGNSTNVFTKVNLEIAKGEFILLLGPSGSGKTTFLNLLAGMDFADSGQVIVDHKDLQQLKPGELTAYKRDYTGYIYQFHNLLPTLTALENIELAAEIKYRCLCKKRAWELLHKINLQHKAHMFPGQLSGGQQQRIAIARGLIKDPALLLGDEPTGNLDRQAADRIMSLFHELNRENGITTVIATNDEHYNHLAPRVLRIENGIISTVQ
ncbi:MAG TPA: ABC transporter ATP-binding protein [Spirochaetota bacterium]|nr:ABC transporter ATP-binding protein [Spirochaetota bacterium]